MKGAPAMCIYCGTNKYRQIYRFHNGPIPKDSSGRRFHIHHIDGNRNNNQADNLVALSIEDHYQLHYKQGDYAAAIKLAGQMSWSHEEISNLAREMAEKHGYKPPSQKGKKYWTNGLANTLAFESPGEGWSAGKTLFCDLTELSSKHRTIKLESITEEKQENWRKKSLANGSKPPNQTGKKRWTNGIRNVMSINCPGPDWWLGLTYKKDLLPS